MASAVFPFCGDASCSRTSGVVRCLNILAVIIDLEKPCRRRNLFSPQTSNFIATR